MWKIFEKLSHNKKEENDEDDELLNNAIENYYNKNYLNRKKLEDKQEDEIYKISRKDAFNVANKDENLKNDFCRQDSRNITNIVFNKFDIDLMDYNNEKYWHVKILDGEISWYDQKSNTSCDGEISKKDLEKLQCLVNVNTGDYLYFVSPNMSV